MCSGSLLSGKAAESLLGPQRRPLSPFDPPQVKAFYGNEAENILISNLKRGIIGLFQLQPHAGTTVEVGPQLGPLLPKMQGCTRRAGPGAQPDLEFQQRRKNSI